MVRTHSPITPFPCFPARSPPQTAPHRPGKARLRSLMQELFSKTSFCHSSISFFSKLFLASYNTIIISYQSRNVNSSSSFPQQKEPISAHAEIGSFSILTCRKGSLFTSVSSPQRPPRTRPRSPVPVPWSAERPPQWRSAHTGTPAAAHRW